MSTFRPARHEAWLWLIAASSWMALIFWLSSGTIDSPLPRHRWSSFVSNCAHFPLYGVLASCWRLFFVATDSIRGSRATLIAIAIAALYGVSDEVHQSFVPGRSASVYDVMTDLGGAAFGVLLTERWRPGRARLSGWAWLGGAIGLLGAALDTWGAR